MVGPERAKLRGPYRVQCNITLPAHKLFVYRIWCRGRSEERDVVPCDYETPVSVEEPQILVLGVYITCRSYQITVTCTQQPDMLLRNILASICSGLKAHSYSTGVSRA